MTNSPREALADSLAKQRSNFTHGAGFCLQTVREYFAIPARDPDATTAWDNAAVKHRGMAGIKRGAPLFWAHDGGSGFGHIVIYVGRNRCRSTDYFRGSGLIATVSVDAISASRGSQPVGWTEDLNGEAITFPLTRGERLVRLRQLKRRFGTSVRRALMRKKRHQQVIAAQRVKVQDAQADATAARESRANIQARIDRLNQEN
jgi:hypothetical protein